MLSKTQFLILPVIIFLTTACSSSKVVNNGTAVEVSKEQRPKTAPAQIIIAKSEITLAPVYFDFDKSDLYEEAKDILQQNIPAVKKAKQITVIGGCDSRGREKYNKILAQKRADAVKEFYIQQGVNPVLIIVSITLKEQNICTEKDDDSCHSKNRKADTVIKLL